MSKYRYRLTCPDCTDIDPQGCFDGGHSDSEEEFETMAEAENAGIQVTLRTIYNFSVIDENGKEVRGSKA